MSSPVEGATLREIVDEVKASYRQIDHWVRKGWLHPESKGGSGNDRRWPDEELAVLRRMARCVNAGLPPALSHELARVPAGTPARLLEIGPGVFVAIDLPEEMFEHGQEEGPTGEAGTDVGPAAETG